MIDLKNVGKALLSKKKAFSAVVTTMLFVSAACTLGIIYYEWAQTSWSNSLGMTDEWAQRRADNMKEYVVIESVWFSSGQAKLMVRNVGVTPISVRTIYVDGTLVLSPNTNLAVGQVAVFTLSVVNGPHTFKIVTSEGSSVSVMWAPSMISSIS
jgi:archaellum component FlaF (FlaF/FlaG flagellin family)